jgi:predicted amidohydrolase YtcJ
VIDGGAENAATDQPYANRPNFNGQLMWAADALVAAVTQAARRGLRVGIHAWGDRAVRTVLDVYEKVLRDVGNIPMGNLVLEHGGLALPEQRARAIKLGIPVTVQHPLLYELAPLILENWGRERTEQIFPLREWLAEGALLAAGSDYPVGPYDAMRSISGMVTRQTRAGILGPEQAIDVATAIRLYTSDAARLMQEQASLGSLEPGKRADIVAYSRDPMTVPAEELGELAPVFTLVGGRGVHDPTGRFG